MKRLAILFACLLFAPATATPAGAPSVVARNPTTTIIPESPSPASPSGGLTPSEAIGAATLTLARVMDFAGEPGTVERGARRSRGLPRR